MNTTELEIKMITAIAEHLYTPLNGEEPDEVEDATTFCWVDDFASTLKISTNSAKGVLGSLTKKNLINCSNLNDEDSSVSLTESGFKIYKESK